eukprot:scaffold30832_cov67-Phaeocystis_antarctica.AAC.5
MAPCAVRRAYTIRGAHVAAAHEEVLGLVGVDVFVKGGHGRLRRGLGRRDRRLHLLLDGHVDGLNLLLGRELEVEQVLLDARDGIARGAHASHLVAVAVGDARVGHGVAVVAVRVHLEDDGTVLEGVRLGVAGHLGGRARARLGSRHEGKAGGDGEGEGEDEAGDGGGENASAWV